MSSSHHKFVSAVIEAINDNSSAEFIVPHLEEFIRAKELEIEEIKREVAKKKIRFNIVNKFTPKDNNNKNVN